MVEKLVPPSRLGNESAFKDIFRSKSRTFSLASLLLPKERAEAIFRLYYVCRTLDDWADEGEGDKLKDAMNCWVNHQPHEVLDHYRLLQARWGLDSLPLTELMEAMIGEQEGVRIQTEAELLKYCHGVAGTIGLMTCPIFGVTNPVAMQHADDLGIAMQLTNICRDVYEDAERERIYLPADFFENMPSVEGLLTDNSEYLIEINQVKTRLLGLAEERYASGEAGICYLPLRMRIVVRWAGRMYREIGELIKQDPSLYHSNRAVVTSARKMRILLPSLFQAFVL